MSVLFDEIDVECATASFRDERHHARVVRDVWRAADITTNRVVASPRSVIVDTSESVVRRLDTPIGPLIVSWRYGSHSPHTELERFCPPPHPGDLAGERAPAAVPNQRGVQPTELSHAASAAPTC
ncbi:MAG: hypothetical protein GXO35_04250 [Gammaproteobacteria bacterium]|nr:hypothetical protein [Gammaproteobacteria bacterium]